MYDFSFWCAYASYTLVSIAATLLCRYADFVSFLGGDEFHLGWIVGVGMVGSLVARFAVGRGIDRYGAKRVWLISTLGTMAACCVHVWIADYRSPWIYAARVIYVLMLATVYSSSLTLMSARAPRGRLAEVIGIFGSAGFAGVILGAPLADWLFSGAVPTRQLMDEMFLIAAGLCALSLPLAWIVPSGNEEQAAIASSGGASRGRRRKARVEPIFTTLRRYSPGPLIAIGIVAGAGLNIPQTFLPRYVADFQQNVISSFFVVYALTALVVRAVLLRRLQRLGMERIIIGGMGLLTLAFLLFLPVRDPMGLLLPGLVFGLAHAVLFPAIVGLGSGAFPKRHRGLATTLMLAVLDAGLFVGAPMVGALLRAAESLGLPRYPAMFFSVAVAMLIADGLYARFHRRRRPRGRRRVPVAATPVFAQSAPTIPPSAVLEPGRLGGGPAPSPSPLPEAQPVEPVALSG
ncbi:MAG: MFS transporter [Thermogutta sp.]|nr:MFS transporter [Thermogutta sp.]